MRATIRMDVALYRRAEDVALYRRAEDVALYRRAEDVALYRRAEVAASRQGRTDRPVHRGRGVCSVATST